MGTRDKAVIRRDFRRRRRAVTPAEVGTISERIREELLTAVPWERYSRVHVYQSLKIEREIDTLPLIGALKASYPNIRITMGTQTATIPLPGESYDCIIVPVLVFDSELQRLGFGAGWYDQFLATQPAAFKIGLAYSWAHVDRLPHEAHDIPLDLLVTEAGLLQRAPLL